MRVRDILRLSTRMFRTRPMRTWLTILGISVGISTVIFLVSLGYGLQKIILERIVFSQALLSLSVTPTSDVLPLTDDGVQGLGKIQHVTETTPLGSVNGQILFGAVNGTVAVRGADAQYFDYAGISATEGEMYDKNTKDGMVISEAVLRLLGLEDGAGIIGKKVQLKVLGAVVSSSTPSNDFVEVPQSFTVLGVVRDPQESYVYVPLWELRQWVTLAKYEQVQLKVDESRNLNNVKDQVIALGYQVASLQETIDQANKIFQVFQVVLGLFGAVALVVSAIGMFNTMTVTLLERTNEIGIMRALGAGAGEIRSMFLSESVILGFLGGVLGIVIGVLTGQAFNLLINNLAVRFGGAKANLFDYPQWFIGAVIIISVVIGFISGVFPSYRASKMDPLEALRYK